MSCIFKAPREKRILAFTTQGGHVSGDLMKNIDVVRPKIIEKMKEEVAKDNTLYRVIDIDDFTFVIARKHYNTKPSIESMRTMLNSLENLSLYMTTRETFPSVVNALETSGMELCGGSSWDYCSKVLRKK